MIDEKRCTGCGACKFACPVGAIEMVADAGGFLYPTVDRGKCISCHLCDTVCEKANQPALSPAYKVFALKHKDETVRSKSTSGGAFHLIAETFLNKGGIVYGVAFDGDWRVVHVRIDRPEEIMRVQRSKYVQSDLGDTFAEVAEDLKNGRRVLFSGTACQCSGLRSFLEVRGTGTDGLFLCDLICHGVPSPKIWEEYVAFRKRKSDIKAIDFRNKDRSWRDFRMAITYPKKTGIYRQNEDYFMVLFFHNLILRESCYHCAYTKTERASDFTLGDFWGIEDYYPAFSDDKGVSVLQINSEKGYEELKNELDKTEHMEVTVDKVQSGQPNLVHPTKRNEKVDAFWRDYRDKGFKYVLKKYADRTVLGVLKRKYLFKFLYYTGIFKLLLKLKNK